jgi:hypothetical protein
LKPNKRTVKKHVSLPIYSLYGTNGSPDFILSLFLSLPLSLHLSLSLEA